MVNYIVIPISTTAVISKMEGTFSCFSLFFFQILIFKLKPMQKVEIFLNYVSKTSEDN